MPKFQSFALFSILVEALTVLSSATELYEICGKLELMGPLDLMKFECDWSVDLTGLWIFMKSISEMFLSKMFGIK